MTLVERVERALDGTLDPDKFEKTVVALLGARYGLVSQIEGGGDLGRDADIYLVEEDGSRVVARVLVTTSDPLKNLKSSHRTWQKNPGFPVERLVLASRARNLRSVEEKIRFYCLENKLPVPDVYGRSWLVGALVRDAVWRTYLLGIEGHLDALAPFAGTVDDEPDLVGRSGEVTTLQAALNDRRDVVLAGFPGVGKTRLIHEVAKRAHLVEPDAAAFLGDDLLHFDPDVVVLDDAHLHPQVLRDLVRLRKQDGLRFALVAATWPADLDSVTDAVNGAVHIEVGELTRREIDQLVRARGVTAVGARTIIQQQAEGRPGWAHRLCDAFGNGTGELVLSGQIATRSVMRYLKTITDSPEITDAVACIAALGPVSLDEVDTIADMVGLPSSRLASQLNRLATGGLLLKSDTGAWQLFPALVAPFVAEWFFGETANRPWSSMEKAFPGRVRDLTRAMLAAATVAQHAGALRAVDRWYSQWPDTSDWNAEVLYPMVMYAQIDESRAARAVAGARAVAVRQAAAGAAASEHDRDMTAAIAVLARAARHWLMEGAIHGLLDRADADPAGLGGQETGPMKAIRDLARHIHPDQGHEVEVRRRIVRHATSWLGSVDDSERGWKIYGRVVGFAMDPEVEGHWMSPEAHMTMSFSHGVLTPQMMGVLVQMWRDLVVPALNRGNTGVPASGARHLITITDQWQRIASGHFMQAGQLVHEHRNVASHALRLMLDSLRPTAQKHPGLSLKLQKVVDSARRDGIDTLKGFDDLALDDDLVLFTGRGEPLDDIETWMSEREREVGELTTRLVQLGPIEGTERLRDLIGMAGDRDDGDFQVARRIADATDNPAGWFSAAVNCRLVYLVQSTLERARATAIAVEDAPLECALADSGLRRPAVAAVTGASVLDDQAARVIDALTPADASALDRLFTRKSPDDVLHALLLHSVREIRAVAAVAFNIGDRTGPTLPAAWRDDWIRAFLDADKEVLGQHDGWRLREILRSLSTSDPDLCAAWFKRKFDEDPSEYWGRDKALDALEHLPQPHREELARHVLPLKIWDLSPVRRLLCHDPELVGQLLDDGTLTSERSLVLLDGDTNASASLIAVLLDHDVDPTDIAQALSWPSEWSGSKADHLQDRLAWFEELPRTDERLRLVSNAAQKILPPAIDRERRKERDAEIRGSL